MVRSLIFGSGLPLSFWEDAAEYASYIINRSPTRGNAGRASSLQVMTGVSPTLTDIVIVGSPCTAIRTPKRKTIDRRGEERLIIGKSDETKGYRVLFTKDRLALTTQHVKNIKTLSEDVNAKLVRQIDEYDGVDARKKKNIHPIDIAVYSTAETFTSSDTLPKSSGDVGHREEPRVGSGKIKKRGNRGGRRSKTTEALATKTKMTVKTRFNWSKTPPREIIGAVYCVDPKNWKEAMESDNFVEWERAAESEIDSLEANDTWEMVLRTDEMRPLHTN
uniref:AlNc14C25G2514 protein n=1 Tax=Albugo laibachii Nc14 TaxID=890382 RepID=F0W6M6_9STRA|nr:AlNc14C25G2514 [Albugo laibachii Nc14]|eukprot:CCA16771.1 AlNc14C25G2514 [Albugo laibachii Nc14]